MVCFDAISKEIFIDLIKNVLYYNNHYTTKVIIFNGNDYPSTNGIADLEYEVNIAPMRHGNNIHQQV
jgi:hypothetical protein